MQSPIISQVVEALKGANNVLITVKNNPSVDELTAAIGLTLLLSHLDKHATTVFSGQVPSTIEFLQPEMAIESSTDSLRDFIISLDKAKADKLRYKVEDNIVRIFITPYRTSITEGDLEFNQGDFNVDVVVALGVVGKEDFDQAVTAHGRILHDATVIGITNGEVSKIGAINWQDAQASSVSEMIAGIADTFGSEALDNQIATALLTGIVAETDRFKNEKTTPQVLALSSKLMSAGANQQLVAEQLETAEAVEPLVEQGPQFQPDEIPSPDGTLKIGHEDDARAQNIDIDNEGNIAGGPKAPAAPFKGVATVPPAQSMPPEEELKLPKVEAPEPPELSDRPYLSQRPVSANDEDDMTPPTGSLFGAPENQDKNRTSDRPDASGVGDHTLDHQHKVIQPLHDKIPRDSQPTPPAPKPPVVGPDSIKFEPTTTAAGGPKQTLRDLERSVQSKHLPPEERGAEAVESQAPAAAPVQNVPPAPYLFTDVPKPKAAPAAPPSVRPPSDDNDKKDDKKVKPENPAKPPRPVYTPPASTAPPGPPPLMPRAGSQPVFYEADGSKSSPLTGSDKPK